MPVMIYSCHILISQQSPGYWLLTMEMRGRNPYSFYREKYLKTQLCGFPPSPPGNAYSFLGLHSCRIIVDISWNEWQCFYPNLKLLFCFNILMPSVRVYSVYTKSNSDIPMGINMTESGLGTCCKCIQFGLGDIERLWNIHLPNVKFRQWSEIYPWSKPEGIPFRYPNMTK